MAAGFGVRLRPVAAETDAADAVVPGSASVREPASVANGDRNVKLRPLADLLLDQPLAAQGDADVAEPRRRQVGIIGGGERNL